MIMSYMPPFLSTGVNRLTVCDNQKGGGGMGGLTITINIVYLLFRQISYPKICMFPNDISNDIMDKESDVKLTSVLFNCYKFYGLRSQL